ncbi:MAG TPA: DUF1592 domain-containing protein, partial [Verrucomicrobiae bacterium]|nr:DUF1592 domain-containing protein [Verrucomicrobiae bacterium]
PDGIRFSPKNTRRDWTEEILAQIREFYRGFTDPRGGDKVNLQGIVFETNEGGRLPLEKYLAASLELREPGGRASSRAVKLLAQERTLSPKYLQNLLNVLASKEPSLLLDPIRARWRTAKESDVAAIAADIRQWQKALWKFNSVGHIGKVGGPKAWMEPISPVTSKQEVRLKVPAPADGKEVTLYLVAGDAGDGNENDFVIWQQPRLVAPGRPTLLLRDLRAVTEELAERRQKIFAATAKSLAAAAEASAVQSEPNVGELARKHGVEPDLLSAWLNYLGIGGVLKIEGHFTGQIQNSSGYDFIKGWGSDNTPLLVANSSDQHVRIPGNMKPHSVAVHPSPKLQAAVGWRSPIAGTFRVEATVQHAHPECGNGVTWSLELRRGVTRQRLAAGTAQGAKEVKVPSIDQLAIKPGDLVSLLIGPRDGNHACDLTALDLVLTSTADRREWNLAKDVSSDVLAGNPHADRFGNEGVWHFYTEPDKGGSESGPVIPAGSLLAKWQAASNSIEKQNLADEVQKLLTSPAPTTKDTPDAKLYTQLSSLGGPLFAGMLNRTATRPTVAADSSATTGSKLHDTRASAGPSTRDRSRPPRSTWGLDAESFGKRPDGSVIDGASLCVHAPSIVEVHLPSDLVAGCEFVTTGVLDEKTGREGSVQLQVVTSKPNASGLMPSGITVTDANGQWTSDNRTVSHSMPIVVNEGSGAHKRIDAALEAFRQIFPAALCYTKIVPVDEVVTLTLYYREDHHLAGLMLDDAQKAKLDRLWDELHYVSHDALLLVDALEQIWQFATQDADPKVFEPLREPFKQRAAAFRQRLIDTEPKHVDAILEFADRAYRRPLTGAEKSEIHALYRKLRKEELPHDEALRLTLARVLVAPAFLYHAEEPGPGANPTPVNDWQLANRLSYFLWSSMPDSELRQAAASAMLHKSDTLVAQTRRMLRDPRVRRMAIEFGCAWLHIHDFDELNEKSERHFPTFAELRGPMYEESIRFFTDFFQNDRSVLNILDADYTFLNEPLAKHYGIPGVKGAEWRRVDGVKKFSRGGILAQSTTLAKQSGASRTSPILRGNWVCEVLLGEKLPRPPKDVPRLPDDEAALEGLTVRQLVEKHSSDPSCSRCHVRIDPYGFALEGFDAIGRRRERDLGD